MKKKNLSAAVPRAELIATHAYGAPVPPPPAAAPPKTPPPADGKAYEPEPYHEDPDETVICPSCQKHNDTDASYCDQCGFELKGADGVKVEPAGEAPAAKPAPDAKPAPPVTAAGGIVVPPPPVKTKGGTVPNTNPVDDAGNIDNGVVCSTPDCGHLASVHTNSSDGDNTGACSTPGCTCQGMGVEADPNSDDDSNGSGMMDDPASAEVKMAVADAPAPPTPPVTSNPPALNEPPPVPGGENMGAEFCIPVGIIEGQPTGDGRQIAPGALDWRVPPIPLMGLATATHDPEGFDMNDPAVICGRIDSLERVAGESGTQIIMAHGCYLANDDGMYFADLNEQMGRLGISADVAAVDSEITAVEIDADGWPETEMTLTKGTIMGFTVCPFPAFEGCYIVLGDGTEKPDAVAIPQQADGPAVPNKPPAAVTAGGQFVHFMTYEECAACDQGFDVMVAAGGPTRPPNAWFSDPNFTEDDGRLVEILDRRGQRALGGKYACPITVTAEGRVFGHIAPWNVCHTGVSGQCILAPHSAVDYAHFKRGQSITTAEGDQIRVGVLTADAGHASTRPGVTATAAMAHYDNTALAVADVNIGEDEHGIWVAGAIRPEATENQVRKLTAASISGDWRSMGGRLELVAALAVNQPGFPLAVVAGGQVETLVAAGASMMHAVKHPTIPDPDVGDVALRRALAPMLGESRKHSMGRLAGLRG